MRELGETEVRTVEIAIEETPEGHTEARALSDLARHLVDEAARTIEQHEGRPNRVQR